MGGGRGQGWGTGGWARRTRDPGNCVKTRGKSWKGGGLGTGIKGYPGRERGQRLNGKKKKPRKVKGGRKG